MKKTNEQIRKEVTATIIKALESGTSPWQRPWDPGAGGAWPHNCITGHNYRGVNFPYLLCCQGEYPTAQWLTFRQAKKAGGTVRKGEKASLVVFAKPLIIKETLPNGKQEKKKIFFLRQTPVFNIAQCDDVKLPKREQAKPIDDTVEITSPVRDAKRFMKSHGVKLKHTAEGRAFYRPSDDTITMPNVNTFKTGEGYAATAYHETVHWTGHESRNKRDLKNSFGTAEYAFEELVAEIGSAMLCHQQGVSSEMPNHASYIKSWIKKLKDDSSFIFKASKLSEQAVNYLLPETARKQEAA
jgi:antirestriction protein ArdC